MSVSFSRGGVTATVQNPDLNDQLNLDPHQVVQPKASGGFYRFALADATDTRRELKWSNLRLSELNDLSNFFENQAQGTLNEFTFTDERNVARAAYFLSATLDPVTVADEAASTGSFVTGGDTVPTTVRSGGFYELTIKLHLSSGSVSTSPATSGATRGATSSPTEAGTSGPTSAPTSPPEYSLESDLLAHEDLTTTAHGGLIASGALVTTIGSPGSDGNVPSEKAVRTALGSAISTAESAAEAASDAAGTAAAAAAASIPASALVTSVGSPGSDGNVPSEKAVRTALGSAISTAESAAEAASDAAGAAATVQGDLNTHAALTTTAHGGLIPSSAAGADSGVATLDASGKVPTTQLPAAIVGALDYQGTYDCSGGSYPAAPAKGQYWVCSVAGTISGVAYGIGDWLTYNGASWNRIDNQQVVSSVCGKVGAVTLSASDVGADASGAAAAAQSAAEAASIPIGDLVTSVGSPGSDSNVPSEKAVRTAIAGSVSGLGSGNVTGPSSSTAGHVALFSDATGKVLEDGGALGTAAFQATGAFDAAGAAAAAQSAAEAASIAASALVTSVGTPGSDSNVPSEKAVRTALTSAVSTAESAAEAASDASGAAATVQGNLNTHTGLTTTAHGGIVASTDSRLTDARTPTAHESTHLTGGSDVLALPDAIEFVMDGGGSAITTGVKGFLEIPFNCTIQRVTLLADQSGSIVVDVQTCAYSGFPTTSSIAASDLPTLSSAQKSQDSTLTGWSTSLTAGNIIAFKVNSATTVTRVTISLEVVRA
jgi:hypothetical protein